MLIAAYIIIELLIDPFHRMFFVNDLNISFPHAEHERVPVTMNFVYSLFTPIFIIVLYNAATGASVHKHHVSVLGIAIAIVLTSTLTDIIKNMVGRPRPDLLARCKPSVDAPVSTLVSHTICTETNHQLLHDGWRSFPSGHSSFAFAGLGYLSLFLTGQLQIFLLKPTSTPARSNIGEGRHVRDNIEKVIHVRGDLGKAIICLIPLLGAIAIAISRCQDYRHDVYDVSVGSILGWTIGYWSYRRYWPRLASSHCDEPYPSPEVYALESGSYGRLRDEEQGNVDGTL